MLFMYPYFIPQTTTQTRIRCYLMFSLYIAKRGTEGPSGLPKDTQLRGSVDWHSCRLVSQLILRTQTNQKQCLLCTDVMLFWVIASFYFTCPGRWQSEKKKKNRFLEGKQPSLHPKFNSASPPSVFVSKSEFWNACLMGSRTATWKTLVESVCHSGLGNANTAFVCNIPLMGRGDD